MVRSPWFLVVALACGPVAADTRVEPVSERHATEIAVREQEVAVLEARILDAKADLAGARIAAEDAAQRAGETSDDVRAARERTEAIRAETDLTAEVAELALDRAQADRDAVSGLVAERVEELRRARQEGDDAEVARAKTLLDAARDRLAALESEVLFHRRELREAQRRAEAEVALRRAEIQEARGTRTLAQLDADAATLEVDRAEARVDWLVARRAVAVAELDRERARAARAAGEDVDLAPFDHAVRRAREDLREAEDWLRAVGGPEELPPAAEPVGRSRAPAAEVDV